VEYQSLEDTGIKASTHSVVGCLEVRKRKSIDV
jgi:hypothetical protein